MIVIVLDKERRACCVANAEVGRCDALGVGIETMRFGDGDARMWWTWILKLVVMG